MRLILILVAALSACTIKQEVTPVSVASIQELCLRENPEIAQAAFEPALIRQIESRGVVVRSIGPREGWGECQHLATYTARWQWDIALYLSFVDITVSRRDGNVVGRANYNTTQGGLNLDKFGKTEDKLAVLVARLFP